MLVTIVEQSGGSQERVSTQAGTKIPGSEAEEKQYLVRKVAGQEERFFQKARTGTSGRIKSKPQDRQVACPFKSFWKKSQTRSRGPEW